MLTVNGVVIAYDQANDEFLVGVRVVLHDGGQRVYRLLVEPVPCGYLVWNLSNGAVLRGGC